jgi:succinate dehydrogenase/fumarate reductase flavoprotein subunit
VARKASTHSSGDELQEVDVLVIGSGAAGLAAALAAHDAGAQVVVVEKCAQAGGNSLVSSANTVYPAHPDDVQRFCRYLTEVCAGTTPAEVIETYVHGLVQLPAWAVSWRISRSRRWARCRPTTSRT